MRHWPPHGVLIRVLLFFTLSGSVNALAEDVSTGSPREGIEPSQQAVAARIIPSLEQNLTLKKGAKSRFNRPVLPRHFQSENWTLQELQVLSSDDSEAELVVLWFYPETLVKGPRFFPAQEEILLGVVALLRGEEVLAVYQNGVTREPHQVWEAAPVLSLPRMTLWAADEVVRANGVMTRNRLYFSKKGHQLLHSGTVPYFQSNLGLCGSFERAKEKRRGLAGSTLCPALWHFEGALKPHRKGLKVTETLTLAQSRRFRAKKSTQILQYGWKNGRFRSSRTSLRQKVPSE